MNGTDPETRSHPLASRDVDFDAIVIGAGISGLFQLHCLRDRLGMNVRVFEAGTGVEVMDTPAACRTYNILLAEQRRVGAALLIEASAQAPLV